MHVAPQLSLVKFSDNMGREEYILGVNAMENGVGINSLGLRRNIHQQFVKKSSHLGMG